MSQSYLSLGRAKQLVQEIVETSPPGKRNAMENGVCCYLNEEGERCIVGEVLHRMRMPAPEWNGAFESWGDLSDDDGGIAAPYIRKGYMTKATAEWLGSVQNIFDGGVSDATPTWRQALKECRAEGLFS